MLILILTAALLIVLTVFIHAFGTTKWLEYLLARYSAEDGQFRLQSPLAVISATALLLIMLHLLEIGLWALAYLILVPNELSTIEEAVYFSAVTFTTLGYGDITLSSAWRMLSGLEAINGILLIGWTTAFLFAILQRFWSGELNE